MIVWEFGVVTIFILLAYRRYKPYGVNWNGLRHAWEMRKHYKGQLGSEFVETDFIDHHIRYKNWGYINEWKYSINPFD